MKITPDATTSARSGIPTYAVAEEDRRVTWTLATRDLEEMADWDALDTSERRQRLCRWFAGDSGALPKESGIHIAGGEKRPAPIDWYEQHAVVARNALRSFLGRE